MNQQPAYIVTHGGKAHLDDFLSCCIALARFPSLISIFRRNPSEEELNRPDVLVLDVGERYEPKLSNFDHHQLPKDAEPECALSLFVKELWFYSALKGQDWFSILKIMDSKGPFTTAKHLNLPRFPAELTSPIEDVFLDQFAKVGEIHSDGFVTKTMKMIGDLVITKAVDYEVKISAVRRLVQVERLDPNNSSPNSIDIVLLKSKETTGLDEVREELDIFHNIFIAITYDNRGNGWTLYRYDDCPQIDFYLLSDDPRILFAHKGGFIAKTKELLPVNEVLGLCRMAMTGRKMLL
ncbi:MAG: MYG1 family protein [Candidatus Thorarchaeota archaeon]|jgi:hypothetical protein